MSFWQFLMTGVSKAESKRHRHIIYAMAMIATFGSSITAGLTNWATNGSLVWTVASGMATIFSVYMIGYFVYIEGTD